MYTPLTEDLQRSVHLEVKFVSRSLFALSLVIGAVGLYFFWQGYKADQNIKAEIEQQNTSHRLIVDDYVSTRDSYLGFSIHIKAVIDIMPRNNEMTRNYYGKDLTADQLIQKTEQTMKFAFETCGSVHSMNPELDSDISIEECVKTNFQEEIKPKGIEIILILINPNFPGV